MKKFYLESLLESGEFAFRHLTFRHVDNEPVFKVNVPEMHEQEHCFFHRQIKDSLDYLEILNGSLEESISKRIPFPVVRFADGEYAFYRLTKECNGLYRQAESISAIKNAVSFHVSAMKYVAHSGKLAPLIFPGNSHLPESGFLSFFKKSRDASAAIFLEFLRDYAIELNGANYVPFYAVYAYLVSEAFAKLADGKRTCIVGSDFNPEACRDWFERRSSRPDISFLEIPDSYVATRWDAIKDSILNRVPADIDLFISGAGVGALPVCADLTRRFSVPAIDAGHVLNMMNGRVDKSNGPRLYTLTRQGHS